MPKRKRNPPEPEPPERAIESQRKQVEGKIFHGKRLLLRALKTAKGFERQKMAKRGKTALTKDDGKLVKRLEAELEVLKVCLASRS